MPHAWAAGVCQLMHPSPLLTHPQVSPASGQLAARSGTDVTVELSGTSEKELVELLKLEVCPPWPAAAAWMPSNLAARLQAKR